MSKLIVVATEIRKIKTPGRKLSIVELNLWVSRRNERAVLKLFVTLYAQIALIENKSVFYAEEFVLHFGSVVLAPMFHNKLALAV